MNYNSRCYPHPILGVVNNFIIDPNKENYKPSLIVSSDFRKIKLEVTFKLDNEELLKIVQKGMAEFCIQLYCKSTMFRQSYSTKRQNEVFEINASQLRDDVEVDFFVCASENIPNYTNKQFSPVYGKSSFDIEIGDFLAFGGSTIFFAHKSPEELKNISSFMNIDTANKDNVPMYNDYDGDKITIILSQEDYEKYQIIKKENLFVGTLHSSLVLPALAEAIRFCKSQNGTDYKDKKWYILLMKLIEKNESDDPLLSAQKILDLPVNRSFESLANF
jgi:hypothetical protein